HICPESTAGADFKIRKQFHPPCILRKLSTLFVSHWQCWDLFVRDMEQFLGQDLVHITARSYAALNVAFGLQLIESVDDGSPRKSVLSRQIARSREPDSGT